MRRIINNIGLALVIIFCYACDSEVDIESAANEICECLNNHEYLDSLKTAECYEKTFNDRTQWIFDQDELNRISTQIAKELGRTCQAALIDKSLNSENSSIRIVEEPGDSKLEQKVCRLFTEQQGLFYVESFGDTTRAAFENGVYKESFPDGSFSRLNFKWTEGCRFELEFVESNHYVKKDFSKPGEIYKYQVIDHKPDERRFILHGYQGDFAIEITYFY